MSHRSQPRWTSRLGIVYYAADQSGNYDATGSFFGYSNATSGNGLGFDTEVLFYQAGPGHYASYGTIGDYFKPLP